jgi:hypothetical protein
MTGHKDENDVKCHFQNGEKTVLSDAVGDLALVPEYEGSTWFYQD